MRAFEQYTNAFHIAFNNGCIVSVSWDTGTYSDNGDKTCEVACFNRSGMWMVYSIDEGRFITLTDGTEVMREITADQLAEIMYNLKNLK